MSYSLRIRPHSILHGIEIAEILEDGKVVGTVVPQENGVKIISAHADQIEYSEQLEGQVVIDDGKGSPIPVPVIYVNFKPGPWTIKNGRVIKLG